MTKQLAIKESWYILGLVIPTLLFVYFNFDTQLGTIFPIMIFCGLFIMVFDYMFIDRRIDVPLLKNTLFKSAFYGLIGYVSFLVLSSLIMGVIGKMNLFSINSVLETLAESQPVFAGSVIWTLIGWGILIPHAESYFFFGKYPELVTSIFGKSANIRLSPTSIGFILLSVIISAGFAFFHLTAKIGLGAQGLNEALIMVFIFGMVSMVLIAVTKEIAPAIFMHVFANTISIGLSFALFSTANLLLIGAATFGILFLLTRSWNIRILRG